MMGFCGDMIDIAKSIIEDPKIIKYKYCIFFIICIKFRDKLIIIIIFLPGTCFQLTLVNPLRCYQFINSPQIIIFTIFVRLDLRKLREQYFDIFWSNEIIKIPSLHF